MILFYIKSSSEDLVFSSLRPLEIEVRVFANCPVDGGSIPDRVVP